VLGRELQDFLLRRAAGIAYAGIPSHGQTIAVLAVSCNKCTKTVRFLAFLSHYWQFVA
jgi:hypothetical protein